MDEDDTSFLCARNLNLVDTLIVHFTKCMLLLAEPYMALVT